MDNNEEFTLGFEDSLFSLGGTVSSAETSNEEVKTNNIENILEEKSPFKYSYKTVYEWFVKDKSPTIDFDHYLRTKPEVYLLFDLIPFEPLPENILATVEAFKNRCFSDIDLHMNNSNEEIDCGVQIKECLLCIESIFKYFDSEDFHFEEDLKQNLYEKLYVSLREKEFDGILDLSEVNALLMVAQQIYLWDGKSEKIRQEIISWIKQKTLEDGCRFESYWDTFVRKVRNKSQFERLNVYFCIEKLTMEYWNLKYSELEIHNQPLELDKEELQKEMLSILEKENLLVDNIQSYYDTFFSIEKGRSGKDYSLKLPADYYQFLKTVATQSYYFTEQQWEQFAHEQKLSKLNDMSVAFILGTQKASTIETIANLLENNRSKAIERIIEGDLETYLYHIDQRNLAKQIEQAKNDFKDDRNNLFITVLKILRGIKDSEEEDTADIDDRQTLMALIGRDAPVSEMVKYLLKRKTREKLNQRILSESNDRNDLNEYLKHKNISFVNLCMNYLKEFPEESNSSGYKNIYEMYADYVLDILIERNAFNFFFAGYKHLINLDYVSQVFIDKMNETDKKMQADFIQFCENITKKSKKKSFFGF